jgi:hypothetical protein
VNFSHISKFKILGCDNRAGPRPGDDVGGPSHDLLVCVNGLCIPVSATPGNAIPAPESSSAVGPGATGLLLPGSPGSLLSPID